MVSQERASRVGSVLGDRYKVLEHLGTGSMGVVYRGEQLKLGRTVAIKFLSEIHIDNERSGKRFEREARAMSKLSHPNCVSVFDFGVDGTPYIVMDHVEGKSLDVLLSRENFNPQRALRLQLQILAGLAHAHGQGIVHRDVKPGNIIVAKAEGAGEQVRLLDFSLAKLKDGTEGGLTGTFDVMGTPFYMSPEQSLGEPVDQRTDLYAAGVILFEMLSGERPFDGDSVRAIFRRHREDEPPTLSKATSGKSVFSRELEETVAKALAKEQKDRFATADEFMDALRKVPEARDITDITLEAPITAAEREARAEDGVDTVLMSSSQQRALEGETGVGSFLRGLLSQKKLLAGALGAAVSIVAVVSTIAVFSDEDEIKSLDSADEASHHDKEPSQGELDDVGRVLEKARALVKEGSDKQAVNLLQSTRMVYPKDARLALELGHIFAEKKWWVDAIKRYENALTLDPSTSSNPELNRNLVQALAGEKIHKKAASLITQKIGPTAKPFLKDAVIESTNPKVRRRAARILESMGQ